MGTKEIKKKLDEASKEVKDKAIKEAIKKKINSLNKPVEK